MRLAVFGATGGTGRAVIEQALAAGDKVTALARRPEALDVDVDVVGGDVLAAADVARTVDGADVVISALGIGMHRHATTVYSHGTANILAAMRDAGVHRLLVVSTSSLEIPSPRRPFEWALAKLLHGILSKPYADMASMERHLHDSDADWTLVRAARLTQGPRTGRYRTARDEKLAGCWSISRRDVAHYLLAHAGDPATYRRTIEIAY